MKRCFHSREFIAALAFSVFVYHALPAAAGEETPAISKSVTQGGLTCFSIDPPAVASPTPKSCDDYCLDSNAVCTGVTSNLSPAQSCEDPARHFQIMCRCCAIKP